jgi:hypothetical protein
LSGVSGWVIGSIRRWSWPPVIAVWRRSNSDPTVFFYTTLMQKYWTSHPPSPAPVVLDIDSPATSGDPF